MPVKVMKNVEWPVQVTLPTDLDMAKSCYSPEFTIIHNEAVTKWELALNFNDRDNKHIGLYLQPLTDISSINFHVNYDLMILNYSNAEKSKFMNATSLCSEWAEGEGHGFSKLLSHDELLAKKSGYIKDGKIYIIATIREHKVPEKPQLEPSMENFDEFFPTVAAEQNGMVTFTCADGIKLSALKEVISAKSKVLKAAFENKKQERQNRKVKMKEFDSVVMKEFLRFIYVGRVRGVENIDMKLYEAAESYMVEGLKEICVESMKERLLLTNCVEIIEFADLHGEKDLFDRCCLLIFRLFIIPKIAEDKILAKLSHKLQVQVFMDLVKISRIDDGTFCKLSS